MKFNHLSNKTGFNQSATSGELASAMSKIEIPDNKDYLAFMEFSNGCLLDSGLSIYSLYDLPERNETFEIDIYAPNFILIGDNSGGMGYLLSLDDKDSSVYSSDLGDLDPKGFDMIADSFIAWTRTW